MCTLYIYRHIRRLPLKRIFTTRELLRYGERGAVDQALYRMVRAQFIFRLARGVFVRDRTYHPTATEIALAKAAAWGKRLSKHAEDILKAMNFPVATKLENAFAVNAHSSSFWTVEGRVHLRGVGARKMQLCQSKVGQILYSLWHLGYKRLTMHHVSIATAKFGRSERMELLDASCWMPAWLKEMCMSRCPAPWVS